MDFFRRKYGKCLIWAVCALAAACGLIWLSRSETGFAQWYAEYLFPVFPNTIGRVLSVLPFSVYEFVLYALISGFLGFLAVLLWNLFRCRTRAKRLASGFFRLLLWAVPAVFLMLTLTCTINYGRTSFGEAAGYEMRDSSADELEQLCEELAAQVNEYASQIPVNGEGGLSLEQSMKTYEEGMALAAQLEGMLAEHRRRIEKIDPDTAEIETFEENENGVS